MGKTSSADLTPRCRECNFMLVNIAAGAVYPNRHGRILPPITATVAPVEHKHLRRMGVLWALVRCWNHARRQTEMPRFDQRNPCLEDWYMTTSQRRPSPELLERPPMPRVRRPQPASYRVFLDLVFVFFSFTSFIY